MPIAVVSVWAETLFPVAKMKKINKLTLCSMLAALAVVVMLIAYFPYLTYGIPMAAGVFIMIAVIEAGKGWGMLTYMASAILCLFFAENEAKLIYTCFAGFYPVLKAVFEGIKSRIVEYVLKFISFNVCVIGAYLAFAGVFGIDAKQGDFGIYGLLILLLLANFVFFIYDVALTRLASFYMWKLHPKISKFIKR